MSEAQQEAINMAAVAVVDSGCGVKSMEELRDALVAADLWNADWPLIPDPGKVE